MAPGGLDCPSMHSIGARSLLQGSRLSSLQPALLPNWLRRRLGGHGAWILGITFLLGVGVGFGSYGLQSHFQHLYEAGTPLAGWENFLRQGAPWQALPPVLVAAACALVGWRRLVLADPEPPIGLSGQEGMPASRLRAVLRREQGVVLIGTEVALGLAGIQGVRLLVYVGIAVAGHQLAAATLPAMVIETLAWGLCAGTVLLWRRRYLGKMESWGV